MNDLALPAAYDAIAHEYDRQVADDLWMRRILWGRYMSVFRPGSHVLDIGCGTGIDALFLAQRGVRVSAIDISPAMIDEAQAKIARAGLSNLVQLAVLDIDDLSSLPQGAFDGIISAFAALNTLPALSGFAADASRLLAPGGRMILHLLNRSSLWEWVGLASHGRLAEAGRLSGRRERTFDLGGQTIHHYLPRAHDTFAADFAPNFHLVEVCGLGITRPPHPIPHIPYPVDALLGRLDALIGRRRPFLDWGRFILLELEKAGTETE